MRDRFGSIKFDEKRQDISSRIRFHCGEIARELEAISRGRSTSLALTRLEETNMWAGKALRDDQLRSNASEGGDA